MAIKKVHLVIVDPQNDFCDPGGSLYVKGADDDMARLAVMINRLQDKLEDIHVTLDCHHLVDVAHPIFWKDSTGKCPDPFTIITAEEVEKGTWTPVLQGLFRRTLAYVKALEKSGRYPLCIWPPHCLIGTWGNNVFPPLEDALRNFEGSQIAMINYVTKGSNIYTEHYSAVKAEVPDPQDPGTQINTSLINTLEQADLIAVAGEAGSHCLANTVRDITNEFKDDSYVKKIVLLEDATSPVTGFEQFQVDFVKEMTARGMQLAKTTEFLV
jgi:nicotinamidase-related amidase